MRDYWGFPPKPDVYYYEIQKFDINGNALFPNNEKEGKAYNISVNSSTGNIWVSGIGDSFISKINAYGGKIFKKFGYNNPERIAINKNNNNIWVADTGNNRIV